MLGEIAGDADRADELAIDEVLSSFYTRTRLGRRPKLSLQKASEVI